MSAIPKERFDLHKAAEDSHSRAQVWGDLRANKAVREMVNPTGEMIGPADEPSEMADQTSQLQKDLSSNGYIVIRELLTADQVERFSSRFRGRELDASASRSRRWRRAIVASPVCYFRCDATLPMSIPAF